MSFLDSLAEENADLIKGLDISSFDDEARIVLSSTFEEPKETIDKTASFSSTFGRIDQEADIDMHQNEEIDDVWFIKKGKLVRTKIKK